MNRGTKATADAHLVSTGPRLFEFTDERDWVDNAKVTYATMASGLALHETVAIDERGRICMTGLHFMESKGAAYPIVVYAIRDLDPAPIAAGE